MQLRGPARYGPFFIVLAIALSLPFATPGNDVRTGWWAAAVATALLMAAIWWLDSRRPQQAWLGLLGALLTYPVVLLLGLADPQHATAFIPVLFLPIGWCALYERRQRLIEALLLAGVTLVLPILLIGAPHYPATTWRRSMLWLASLALIAYGMQSFVRWSRHTTRSLAVSEQRYRAAFAEAPTAIAIVGAEERANGIVLQANGPLHDLLGCPPGTLVGRHVRDFVHPDDLDRVERDFAGIRPGDVHSTELRLTPDVGPQRWASVSFTVTRANPDEPLRFVCHVADVTGRRAAEQALRAELEREGSAATELREAAQARTDLVAAVSHDVRTPLATINAYVQLLETGDAGELNDEQREMLDVIEQNVQRAYRITEDLLPLGRVEHDAATAERDVVDIGALVERTVSSIAPNAEARRQHLTLLGELGDARVVGFPGQLDRMLGNLLTNAVKFTPEGGTITVRAFLSHGDVVIAVTDTGMGIPEDEQERIFERFYRADQSRRSRLPGTGLGLAIVREIVAVHGGTIGVRSTPGNGATFTVTLPALTRGVATPAGSSVTRAC